MLFVPVYGPKNNSILTFSGHSQKTFLGGNEPIIRKDCFQVKSNLLTVDNLVFHLELQFLIKLK
jgi:hypothetical protein